MQVTQTQLRYDTPAFSPTQKMSGLNPDATEFSATPKTKGNATQLHGLNPLSMPFNPGPTPVKNHAVMQPQQPQQPLQPQLIVQPNPQPMPMPQHPVMADFSAAANNFMPMQTMPPPPMMPQQMQPGPPQPPPPLMQQPGPPMHDPGLGDGDGYEVYDLYSEYAPYDGPAPDGGGPQPLPPQPPGGTNDGPGPQMAVQRPQPPIPPRPQPPGAMDSENGYDEPYISPQRVEQLQETISWQTEQIKELEQILEDKEIEIRKLRQTNSKLETNYDELKKRYQAHLMIDPRRHHQTRMRRRMEQETWSHYDNVQSYVDSPERPLSASDQRTREKRDLSSNGHSMYTSNGHMDHSPSHHLTHRQHHLRSSPERLSRSPQPSRSHPSDNLRVVTAIESFRATQPHEIDLTQYEEYYPVKNSSAGGSMVEVTSKTGKRGWVPASHLTAVV